MLNSIKLLCMKIKNIFKNRATLRTCLSLTAAALCSIFFSLTSNANSIITIICIIVTFCTGILFATHQKSLFKTGILKLFKKHHWIVILSIFIGLMAFVPLIVRIIEKNEFNFEYFIDNTFANICGAGIVISIILHQHKFAKEKQNEFEALCESQNDWLELYFLFFFDGTVLIILNFTSSLSNFDFANSIFLLIVIFLGVSITTLFLSQIVGVNDLLNIVELKDHTKENEKTYRLYPIGTLVFSSLFLLSHAIPAYFHWGNAGNSIILLTNCISIVATEILGYILIYRYIIYCLDGDNKKLNCPTQILLFSIVIPTVASVVCFIVNVKNETEISNQIVIGAITILFVFIVFFYLIYLQNKYKIHKFIDKKGLLKSLDEELKSDNNKYIDNINCCLKKECENNPEIVRMLKMYLIMDLFNIDEERIIDEIKYNTSYRDFCEIDEVDDKIKENFHEFIKMYDNTNESKQFLLSIKELMKTKKSVCVTSIEYVEIKKKKKE